MDAPNLNKKCVSDVAQNNEIHCIICIFLVSEKQHFSNQRLQLLLNGEPEPLTETQVNWTYEWLKLLAW